MKVIGILLVLVGIVGIFFGMMMFGDISVASGSNLSYLADASM